jgi:hypothetical protein
MGLPHPDARPIETAPKDNPHLWLYMGGQWLMGRWHETTPSGYWMTYRIQPDGTKMTRTVSWENSNQPTHWRPIK